MLDSPALPHLVNRYIGNMSRAQQRGVSETEAKVEDPMHHEDRLKSEDAAAVAVAEEHSMSIWDALRNNKRIVGWCFFFSLSAIGWGFDAQVNGAMISVPSFRSNFGYYYEGEPTLEASWQVGFNSISSVGQFFGGFACSWLADRIGRRGALLGGLLLVTGGVFGEVFSSTNGAFLVSKLLLGIGLGFYLTISVLYMSEISPVVLRGITTASINLSIVIGQFLSNAAIRGFGAREDTWAYKGPFMIQLIFVAFLVLGLPFVPESPWYYVRKERLEKARKSLVSLYSSNVDVGPKLAILVKTVNEDLELSSSANWIDCFQGTNLVRTIISMGVFACQHLSGIVFVLGFSTYFFELAGLSVDNAFDLGLGVTACGVVGNLISWTVINTLGRRKTFVSGMVALTCVLLLIGILDAIPTIAAKWVQASLTVVYALFYQASIGAIAFAVLGETSSPTLRAKTIGLATATQSVFGTVMNIVVPYMVNPDKANLKGKVGFVFGGASAIATIWSFFYVPELKGRTFDEIDYMFKTRVKPRAMGSYTIPYDHE